MRVQVSRAAKNVRTANNNTEVHSMKHLPRARLYAMFLLGAFLYGCSDGSDNFEAQTPCGTAAAQALQQCITEISNAIGACYADSDAACDDGNADGRRHRLAPL